jgi:hypothetical protein
MYVWIHVRKYNLSDDDVTAASLTDGDAPPVPVADGVCQFYRRHTSVDFCRIEISYHF